MRVLSMTAITTGAIIGNCIMIKPSMLISFREYRVGARSASELAVPSAKYAWKSSTGAKGYVPASRSTQPLPTRVAYKCGPFKIRLASAPADSVSEMVERRSSEGFTLKRVDTWREEGRSYTRAGGQRACNTFRTSDLALRSPAQYQNLSTMFVTSKHESADVVALGVKSRPRLHPQKY